VRKLVSLTKCYQGDQFKEDVARMGEINSNNILVGKPEDKNRSEELGVDGRIT
jgi:hypothetical protein